MIILLMGPAGSGKTTVGKLLASQLSWEFADGDDFHSPANIDKMSHGIPLTDEDRIPWLDSIREKMQQWKERKENAVITCSALKRSYRELLGLHSKDENVKLVYLKGAYDLLLERLRARKGHYMREPMLASQLADLEEPADTLTLDAAQPTEQIVAKIRLEIGL